jgi:hypothetical protein
MHSAYCVLAFGLLLNVGVAQVTSPTASQLAAMERFATQPTARVTWSKEVERIDGAQSQAVFTALIVEDREQTSRQVRGIRIDLTKQNVKDRVYVSEDFLERLIRALDEISEGMGSSVGSYSGGSRCFGSCAFLSAVREGAHFFHASQCSMEDGWFGLSVTTGATTFRFSNLNPKPFASAIARARDELKQH